MSAARLYVGMTTEKKGYSLILKSNRLCTSPKRNDDGALAGLSGRPKMSQSCQHKNIDCPTRTELRKQPGISVAMRRDQPHVACPGRIVTGEQAPARLPL